MKTAGSLCSTWHVNCNYKGGALSSCDLCCRNRPGTVDILCFSAQCKQRIAFGSDRCSEESCASAVLSYSSTTTRACPADSAFDIRVTLSDHTGSVSRCVVAGPVAEKMLGFAVQ